MSDRRVEDRLSGLLEELGPADPPDSLVPDVMKRVADIRRRGTGAKVSTPVVRLTRGGLVMTRKVIWGLAVAAAITLAFFAGRGFPPVGTGTEGTIGAAKRYQAQQLSDKDVVLGDTEAQAFLQSDAFTQLINDEASRKLLSDANVRVAMRNDALVKALADRGALRALSSVELARLFRDPSLKAALMQKLHDSGLRPSVAAAALGRNISDAEMKGVMKNADLMKVLGDAELMKVMAAHAALWRALEDTNLARSLSDDSLRAGLSHQAFYAAVTSRGFSSALASARFEAAIAAR
jgi:hypothetical protein